MARYKLVRNPNPNKDGKIQPYHARFAAYGTIDVNKVASTIADRSTFSQGEVKGMLQMLEDLIVEQLKFGNNVNLDGIGTFSASLKCRPVMDKKEIRSESVQFRHVNYRPSVKLTNRLKGTHYYRVEEEGVEKKSFTREERKERLLAYFQNHKTITGVKYRSLNQCSRSLACADLRQFYKEGIIDRKGNGPLIRYLRKEIDSSI